MKESELNKRTKQECKWLNHEVGSSHQVEDRITKMVCSYDRITQQINLKEIDWKFSQLEWNEEINYIMQNK